MLKGKNIVIGVNGGIAVYKVVDVVSRLRKLGANIDVIMSKAAQEFVTPLTFQTLSSNFVVTDMFEEPKSWDVKHISLADKADLFLLAPATANIIGKMANGIADDMISTTVMATRGHILIAPAMNVNMYEHPVTQENIEKLKGLGCEFVDPAEGLLACNYVGKGKLAPPEEIVQAIINHFKKDRDLEGKKVLVTAGPTREAIDPVRYLSNNSTGKMGYEISRMARDRGAQVILVSGPTHLDKPQGVEYVGVDTAEEMYNAVMKYYDDSDIVIKAAAVSDYRPESKHDQKMKKSDDDVSIKLVRNKDILKNLGVKKKHQILVGFAAETNNVEEYAKEKIASKNLDFIVANDITDVNAGFSKDTNVVTIIDKNYNFEKYGAMSKYEVAGKIFDKINTLL